jgi:hypothetical protein
MEGDAQDERADEARIGVGGVDCDPVTTRFVMCRHDQVNDQPNTVTLPDSQRSALLNSGFFSSLQPPRQAF